MRITVGITGASGSIYGYTLIRMLKEAGADVSVILTEMGEKVLYHECGLTARDLTPFASLYDNNDLFSDIASGSVHSDGMAVIPCSMNTLGSIANGTGNTLLTRAAGVTLKEGRRLVAVVRETPYSLIHLKNMVALAEAGACILPASPGFYTRPTEIWQLVEGIAVRVLDQFGIEWQGAARWKGDVSHDTGIPRTH